MSLDDVINAMQMLGMGKDSIKDALLSSGKIKLDDIDKALDGITDKGGILNSLFTSLGNGAKSFGTALQGFLVSPAAKIVGAMLAIAAAVKFLDWVIVTPKEALDNMSESFGEFENAQSEVEALNSELEQTKNSIADLQAKGNLSLVDKEELHNLREAEKSLEMQKELAEKLALSKAEQAATNAAIAYEKNFKNEISQAATDKYLGQANSNDSAMLIGNLSTDKSNVSSMIAGLERITELRDKSTDKATWDSYNETVQDTTTSIWEQADALMEQKTILEESKKAIEENGGRLTDYQQTALDNINSSLDYIYKEMSPETWKQMKIDDIFSQYDTFGTKEELTELAKQYSNLDDFVAAATKTQSAFAQSLYDATDGAVTLRDVAENIFAEAGVIDTNAVRQQLRDTFADITGMGGWAERAKGEFNAWANSLSKEDLELVYKIMLDTETANYDLATWKNTLEEYKASQALDHGVDITTEQEGLEKVTSAISENVSEVGLLDESISSLKSRYKAIADFEPDKLFEQTANGIRLNTEYLNQMETEYATENLTKLNDALTVAAQKAKDAQIAMELNSDPEFANAYKIRYENALDEVKAIQQLITQYNALNGAYAKAMKAAESANGGAMRDNVKSLWDSAKELKKAGKVGTDDFQSFVELMTGKDYKGNIMDMVNDFDKLNNNIKVMKDNVQKGTLGQSVASFFVDGKQGALNFINAIKQAGKLYDGSEWVKQEITILKFLSFQ